MFTDKLTLAIAEAAKKCMDEELKGNQHKIDANKNGKIDSQDFKILRSKDKVDEELKGNQHKIDANKNGKIDAQDFKILRKEETVNEEEGKYGYVAFSHKGDRHELYANSSYEAYKKAVNHFKPPKSKQHLVHVHLAQKDGKDVTHIATEAVQEGAIDDLRDRQAAARESNPYGSTAKKEPVTRKVQGSQYGGTKQKHEPEKELDEGEKRYKEMNGVGKSKYTVSHHDGEKKHKDGSNFYDIKLFKNKNEKNKFVKDLDSKGYTKEEVELDESKAHIEQHLADKDINAKVTGKTVQVHSSNVSAAKRHLAKAGYADHKVVSGLNEEKMSDEDMAERERIVKGMKKNLQSFKSRYGARAKDVMYATATKQAMKEEEQLDELSKDTLKSYREKAFTNMLSSAGKAIGHIANKDKPAELAARATWEKRIRGVNAADKKLKKEEVEQLDELSKDTLQSYAKKAQADKDDSINRYNAHDRDEKGNKISDKDRSPARKAIDKLLFNRSQKRIAGLKAANAKLAKEEVTNDTFNAELEDNKAKAAGTKKQPDVHKAAVQSVKQESFTEKLSMLKEDVRQYMKGKNNG